MTIDGFVSKLTYEPVRDNVLDLQHTFVPPELRGRGIAATLCTAAFEYAKSNDKKLVPSCTYISET